MSIATTTKISPSAPWGSSSSRTHQMPSSTTPHGLPIRTPSSVGQPLSPAFANKTRSPHAQIPSPGYFGFLTDQNSAPAENSAAQTRKKWGHSTAGLRPSQIASPKGTPVESMSNLEAFRRQSESNPFNLSHGNLSNLSAGPRSRQSSDSKSPDSAKGRRDSDSSPRPRKKPSLEKEREAQASHSMEVEAPDIGEAIRQSQGSSLFDQPRIQSPTNVSSSDLLNVGQSRASYIDEKYPRYSLPHNQIDHVPTIPRAETLPTALSSDGPTMVSPSDLAKVIQNHLPMDVLLLDIRVFAQYSTSRIAGALNLNLPTTLLKRPTYDIERLSSTFSNPEQKARFDQWMDAKFIVVYDACTSQLKDAATCINTLKKFTNEGWQGTSLVLKGGFAMFSKGHPDLIDKDNSEEEGKSRKLSIDPSRPVTGGCFIPATQTGAMPFFSSIRQNLDLRDGVGQLPVVLPALLNEKGIAQLPVWLRIAADDRDKGKTVSEKFLKIEKAEQRRMQQAYTGSVSYGSPNPEAKASIQIAGIEKGNKNRYKDMLPYDHSRVRLQNIPPGDCDYVNASHIRAEWSNKSYIASQAPVPATFKDFWRVTWEQDARVIVMLTAESEGGQTKCHPYWLPGDYGPLRVQNLGEKRVSLDLSKPLVSGNAGAHSSSTSPLKSPISSNLLSPYRSSSARRRSTTLSSTVTAQESPINQPVDTQAPHLIVRKLLLSHIEQPYAPLREITQLQYSSWPDFGAPAHPSQVLSLVEQCGIETRNSNSAGGADEPAREGERPIVVHCSAGCGRTGTFCTVDSVIDIMKRQNQVKMGKAKPDAMDIDRSGTEDWALSEQNDLVAKTVEDFRLQRLSMVQTLRQFVLCYESVLEWVALNMPEGNLRKQSGPDRWSFHG